MLNYPKRKEQNHYLEPQCQYLLVEELGVGSLGALYTIVHLLTSIKLFQNKSFKNKDGGAGRGRRGSPKVPRCSQGFTLIYLTKGRWL